MHTTDSIYEWNRPGIYLPSISAVYSRSTALSNLKSVSPTDAIMRCRDGRLAAIDHRYRRRMDVRPSPSMSATGGMHRRWIRACMGEEIRPEVELFFRTAPTALYGRTTTGAVCGGWPTRVVGRVVSNSVIDSNQRGVTGKWYPSSLEGVARYLVRLYWSMRPRWCATICEALVGPDRGFAFTNYGTESLSRRAAANL